MNEPGFYLMNEPDAPLSFTASLGLAALLHDLVEAGSQIVVATHSPVVAAIPGASLLELGSWGIQPATWEDLTWWWPGGSSCATRERSSGTCW